jgi:hypothetical protein
MGALALSPLEQAYERSGMEFERIVFFLQSPEAAMKTESELEREIEKRTRELMRMLLQEHIDGRGPGKCVEGVQGADGVERTHVRLQNREIETVFGTVEENRSGYGFPGVESIHPLDAELNLPDERYSLELRRRVAEQAAGNSFDETLETIRKTTGGHIEKRQIEELAVRAARDFDAFYSLRHAEAADRLCNGSILVMSADGKGVVMRPEDLREHTRKAAEAATQKMGTRLSRGEKKNRKRMATVAAVYTIMPYVRNPEDLIGKSPFRHDRRPCPEQKRVWASLEKKPEEVIRHAFEEARHRDPDGQKTWVALVDGNRDQIRIFKRVAKEKGVHLTIIVDLIHVIEYLWKAGRAFHPESGPELESWVEHRLLEILRGKAGWMAGGMRRSATRKALSGKAREPVDICAAYLLNYAPYLRYDRCLAQGLPVATGVIEGACRHLVKDRMDVTGARWSLAGAEAVLRLRALKSSHDFEQYWSFHEACEYEKNHKNLYASGKVPAIDAPKRNRRTKKIRKSDHLKVIK